MPSSEGTPWWRRFAMRSGRSSSHRSKMAPMRLARVDVHQAVAPSATASAGTGRGTSPAKAATSCHLRPRSCHEPRSRTCAPLPRGREPWSNVPARPRRYLLACISAALRCNRIATASWTNSSCKSGEIIFLDAGPGYAQVSQHPLEIHHLGARARDIDCALLEIRYFLLDQGSVDKALMKIRAAHLPVGDGIDRA